MASYSNTRRGGGGKRPGRGGPGRGGKRRGPNDPDPEYAEYYRPEEWFREKNKEIIARRKKEAEEAAAAAAAAPPRGRGRGSRRPGLRRPAPSAAAGAPPAAGAAAPVASGSGSQPPVKGKRRGPNDPDPEYAEYYRPEEWFREKNKEIIARRKKEAEEAAKNLSLNPPSRRRLLGTTPRTNVPSRIQTRHRGTRSAPGGGTRSRKEPEVEEPPPKPRTPSPVKPPLSQGEQVLADLRARMAALKTKAPKPRTSPALESPFLEGVGPSRPEEGLSFMKMMFQKPSEIANVKITGQPENLTDSYTRNLLEERIRQMESRHRGDEMDLIDSSGIQFHDLDDEGDLGAAGGGAQRIIDDIREYEPPELLFDEGHLEEAVIDWDDPMFEACLLTSPSRTNKEDDDDDEFVKTPPPPGYTGGLLSPVKTYTPIDPFVELKRGAAAAASAVIDSAANLTPVIEEPQADLISGSPQQLFEIFQEPAEKAPGQSLLDTSASSHPENVPPARRGALPRPTRGTLPTARRETLPPTGNLVINYNRTTHERRRTMTAYPPGYTPGLLEPERVTYSETTPRQEEEYDPNDFLF